MKIVLWAKIGQDVKYCTDMSFVATRARRTTRVVVWGAKTGKLESRFERARGVKTRKSAGVTYLKRCFAVL